MGCDIHLTIEYKTKEYYIELCTEYMVERHYALFCALAGVRGEQSPLYPPRGFPKDASMGTYIEYYTPVIDDSKSMGWETLAYVPLRNINHPSYKDCDIEYNEDGKPIQISDPDAHHTSWLSESEILKALAHHGLHAEGLAPNTKLLLKILADLRHEYGHEARIIFWFDN